MSKSELCPQAQAVAAIYDKHGGNVSAIARELNKTRSTIRHHIAKLGKKKPLVGGSIKGIVLQSAVLPAPGQVKRYICTSAQNNTKVNEKVWENILALAKHYDATILVGTYSYNRNAYGKLAVKRDTKGNYEKDLWYDDRLLSYICDERRELGHGLVWCGEMNIIPTAEQPLSGLETYSGRKSAIFPHAKIALDSVAAMKGEHAKINYTTGTVTQRNYIQKKAGLKGEHHHVYGAVLVEVNANGNWWVRQLDADERSRIYDLRVLVEDGKIFMSKNVEAITWGDFHATTLDPQVTSASLGEDGMLETLRPRIQFIHDLVEGVSVNHHGAADPHEQFKRFLRGFDEVGTELDCTARCLKAYNRPWCQTVVVDSNHDNWIFRWLKEHDYRRDPRNAMLFLELQLASYKAIAARDAKFNLTEVAMRRSNCPDAVRFLRQDESFTTCGGLIENGMHGHLGPHGARGTTANLSKVGRRANTGHTHVAEILNGLYVAGTSTTLDMGYNKGPSAWSHSHIVTYPNGKRTIITMFDGKWRA